MVASIAGTIFSDLDFDGVRDSQEAGLENFEIQLLDSCGNIQGYFILKRDKTWSRSN